MILFSCTSTIILLMRTSTPLAHLLQSTERFTSVLAQMVLRLELSIPMNQRGVETF
jgi:hypothetical protein